MITGDKGGADANFSFYVEEPLSLICFFHIHRLQEAPE